MKVLFCGAGTAGHVIPGVAIAEAIMKKDPKSKVMFIGRAGGGECDIIKKRGYSMKEIEIQGLNRKNVIKNIKCAMRAIQAIKEAKAYIKDFEPDIIVGTGGYVCWPVLTAGKSMRIPTIIHESNAAPGLTTRLLAGKVDSVLLNVKECKEHLKGAKKIKVVGNPLLDDFEKYSKSEARRRLGISQKDFFILSFGGSGGAEAINNASIALMKSYSQRNTTVKHLHATGKSYYEKVKQAEPALVKGTNGCKILPYINNMAEVMTAADIVISRCGAMTLSEICMSSSVGILIPSPNVTDNHQYKNAKHLADKGAGVLIEEDKLSLRTLLDVVGKLHNDRERCEKMSILAKAEATPNAKELIVKEIYDTVATKK